MKWQQFERWGRHNVEYGTAPRKVLTVVRAPAAAGLAAGPLAVTALARKLGSRKKARRFHLGKLF